MSTDTKIDYLTGTTTCLMFVFSWFLPNEKTEWIALVGILITYVITEIILVNQFNIIPEHVINGFIDAIGRPTMSGKFASMFKPISITLLLLLTTLIPLSIAIVVNNKNKDAEDEYKELMKDYKTILMTNIISIISFILAVILATMININNNKMFHITFAVLCILIGLFYMGSSIWMMYRASEIMRQYKKSE